MAEHKRHRDVPQERFLEDPTHTRASTQVIISPSSKVKNTPDSEDNHHKTH